MNVSGRSDVGMLPSENQDAFGECVLKNGAHLAVLCDGMGGVSGGREAAEICVRTFLSAYAGKDAANEEDLRSTLHVANEAILADATKNGYIGTGTTLVLALAEYNQVTLFWVGDSRGYLLHEGTLSRLTRDHSYVQELVDAGEISEKEARTHKKRHLITRAVGATPSVVPDVYRFPWSNGDRLLLCSDGLFGMVEEKEIEEILKEEYPTARTVHELVCAANSHGGEDNVTVVLLENIKENYPDA